MNEMSLRTTALGAPLSSRLVYERRTEPTVSEANRDPGLGKVIVSWRNGTQEIPDNRWKTMTKNNVLVLKRKL